MNASRITPSNSAESLTIGGASADLRHPAEISNPLKLFDHPQLEIPDLSKLRHKKVESAIAVAVHIYYPEIWIEIQNYLGNIREPFDLFVTLVFGVSSHLEETILNTFPTAEVFVFMQNRGRDIARFMALMGTGVFFRYEIVCKVHSKRSQYVADGDQWRRELISGVLGTEVLVEKIINKFRETKDLGIVVADNNMYTGESRWAGNKRLLSIICGRAGFTLDFDNQAFPGGGIFWIRPVILGVLRGINIDISDFEPEPLPIDGALGHAIERIFGCICQDLGLQMLEAGQLD